MRFFDSDDIVRSELAWQRDAALGVRKAVDALTDLSNVERSALRHATLMAWMRWRTPVVQQLAVMVFSTLLTAVSMLAATGIASYAAGARSGHLLEYAILLTTAVSVGITINRFKFIHTNVRLMWNRRSELPAAYPSVTAIFPAAVSILLLGGAAIGLAVLTQVPPPSEEAVVAGVGAVFGLLLGVGTGRWMRAWSVAINIRYKYRDRERPLDGAAYLLTMITARAGSCGPCGRPAGPSGSSVTNSTIWPSISGAPRWCAAALRCGTGRCGGRPQRTTPYSPS